MKKVIVTGGAGFIGSNLVRHLNTLPNVQVVNIDKLTYAGNLASLAVLPAPERHRFVQSDICDYDEMVRIVEQEKPDIIMHLAAESHVDRSIDGPAAFVNTNLLGTFNLLEASRRYWQSLNEKQRDAFRFHHISTDEVFGDLHGTKDLFTENTPYQPSSPYSATKAGSDHLVRAWCRTYGLPVVITNCSNNYGPYQYPEKLLPLMVMNAREGRPLPVYGDGSQIRDWLYVQDHVEALWQVVSDGTVGDIYNIGGHNEKTNLEVVTTLCALLDDKIPVKPRGISRYADLITFVEDRPGHDQRYAIDASKIQTELGWRPKETFESGLEKTLNWYLSNQTWCEKVQQASSRERLGLKER